MAFVDVRPDERRSLLGAVLILFGLLMAHTMMETARDAMFLAHLPASRLPLAYLGIGAGSLLLSRLPRALGKRLGGRHAMLALQLLGAAAAVVIWLAFSLGSRWLFVFQYVWTGVFATTALTVFWLLTGSLFNLSQGKRLYGLISAGGGVGAVAGSLTAALCANRFAIEHVLLLAAAVLVLTSAATLLLPRRAASAFQPDEAPAPPSLRSGIRAARDSRGSRYLLAMAGLTALAAFTQMLVDYRFKSSMAAAIPADWLGTLFGAFYTVLGVVALLFQALSGPVILRIGVTPMLNVLPALLVVAEAGLPLLNSLLQPLLLKATDSSLRPSLHRTGMELLYLPLDQQTRSRVKPLLEGAVARGGQAAAALLLTALAVFHVTGRGSHVALLIGAAVWLVLAVRVRRPYLDLLRDALSSGGIDARERLPPLDLNSLEVVVAALNSPDDQVVITAIDLLAAQRKHLLIPTVLLYHPSTQVTVRTLEVLHQAGHADLLGHARRLASHPASEVRAALLRLPGAGDLPDELLRSLYEDPSMVVRVLAAAARHDRRLLAEMASGPAQVRAALLEVTDDVDLAFSAADSAEPEVVRAASRAAERTGEPRFLPLLISRLGVRAARREVRQAMVSFGDRGLRALDAALDDAALDPITRRHIPRTISQFRTQAAVDLLVHRLEQGDDDGVLRFKALRGLGRLVADNPQLRPDRRAIGRIALTTAKNLHQYYAWGVLLRRHHRDDPALLTDSGRLLLDLLEDKSRLGLERLFRLLAILDPAERLIDVFGGITSGDPAAHALALEMLENLLSPPLRDWVLPLLDELDEQARFTRIARHLEALPQSYAELLQQLRAAGDEVLTLIAGQHSSELGLRAGAAQKRVPRRGTGRLAFAAAATACLFLAAGAAPAAESRGAPDVRKGERYDGRPRKTSRKKVLLAAPRAVLAVPRYTLWALSWPLRGLIDANQRYHVVERMYAMSTSADGLVGVRAEINYSLDVHSTLGVSFFNDRAFGPKTSLNASFATWGPDVIVAKAHARPLPAGQQPVTLDVDVQYIRRNDQLFAGIGMATPARFSRYAIDEVDVRAEASLAPVHALTLRVFSQYGLRQFGNGVSYNGNAPIAQVYCRRAQDGTCVPGTVDDGLVPGFNQGTQFIRYGVSLHADLREPRYGTGPILDAGGDVTPGSVDTQPTYFRGRVGVGAAVGLLRRRVLYLHSAVHLAAPLGDRPIPFTELPTLGGADDLRGFIDGRFRDYSSLLFTAEYRWPVWMWVDGTLFADYGGVYGKGFADFEASKMRPDIGIGVRAQSRSRFILRVQAAYGFGDGGGFRLIVVGSAGPS